MKRGWTFLSCLGSLCLLLPVTSQGQCSNQVTLRYYDNGVETSQVVNKGQNGFSAGVCPVAGALYSFRASSTSAGTFTWSKVISRGATSDADVVDDLLTTGVLASGANTTLSVAFTTSTVYRVKAAGTTCKSINYVYLTVNPSLTLVADVSPVCAGGRVKLTATGSTSGTYQWSAGGVLIPNQTGSTLTVQPTTTTTYTVTTTTSCGTSSQQITIPVKAVTLSPAAPTVCAGQSTTLTATYSGSSATYQWYVKGQTVAISSSNTLSVAPLATTTYQLVATTTDCSTITREVTVTIGAPTVQISPAAPTVCAGGSTTLTATSNNPNATFAWSPSTGLSATTGATVQVSPTATTTYTVRATVASCGEATQQVVVTVAPTATTSYSSAASLCAGEAAMLTASSNITAATYAWYNTADLGTILSSSTSLRVGPTATTTYRAVVTTTCSTDTKDIPVTVNARPSISVSSTATTIKKGDAVTLTATGANTYSWTTTSDNVTTNLAATTAAITVSPATTTTYTVTGVTSATGCSNAAQTNITVNQVLPVKLIHFQATWVGEYPSVTWTTASEQDNAYFQIERSLDGQVFQAIGRRAGLGNSSARTDYQFSDVGISSGSATIYYQLRQVDATGEVAYSGVRAVRAPVTTQALAASVFPNPYEKAVMIAFETLEASATTITLYDVLGNALFTQVVPVGGGIQRLELRPAAGLPKGVYYVTIRQGQHGQALKLVRE